MTWTENPPVAVILARQFNPSVLSQVWLSRHGILDAEGTVKTGSIFTESIVHVVTDEFVLAVLTQQLQFIPTVEPAGQSSLVTAKLGSLLGKLPHVPYSAVGLNFNWHLLVDAAELPALSRQLFARNGDGVFARFQEPNARFGAYMSKDVGPFRMMVDIKPINVELAEGEKQDRIQFGFNFHSDLRDASDAAREAETRLAQWDRARDEAIQVLEATGLGQPL